MPLTDTACRNAKCPGDRAFRRVSDAGGLYLEVTRTGSKLWRWKYRYLGKEKRLALVFIACARHLVIPARYVSGYLCSQAKSGSHVAWHVWVEAWVENRWSSFDLARNAPIGEGHVRLAVGADHLDACPIRGVRVGGGAETMTIRAELLAPAPQ